jgi:hypothetical protein
MEIVLAKSDRFDELNTLGMAPMDDEALEGLEL